MDADADGFVDLGVLKPVAFSQEEVPVPEGLDGFPDLSRLPDGRSDYIPASSLAGCYVRPSDLLADILEAPEAPTDEGSDAMPPEFDGAISLADLPSDGVPTSSFGLADTVAETRAADVTGGELSQKLTSLIARVPRGDSITEEPGSAYRVSEAPTDMAAPSLPAKDSEGGVDAFTHLFASTGAAVEEVLLLSGGASHAVGVSAQSDTIPYSSVTKAPLAASPLFQAASPERHAHVGTGGVPDPAAFLPEAESHADAARRFAALTPARAALPPRLRAMMADGLSGLLASLGAPPLELQLKSAGLDAAAAAAAAAALVVHAEDVVLDADDIVTAPPGDASASSATESAPRAEIPTRVTASTTRGPAVPFRIAVCQVHSVQGDVSANIDALCTVLRSLSGKGGSNAAGVTNDDPEMPLTGGGCAAPLADLVVFPETFLTGYHVGPALLRELAAPLPSAVDIAAAVAATRQGGPGAPPHANPLLRVACAAAEHGIAVCLPYAEAVPAADAAGGAATVYNSVSVFDRDGAVVAHYRKSHLWVPSAGPALSDGAPPPAYESVAFVPGPGPAVTHPTLRYGATSSAGDPFVPFTLSARPDLPIGLLVCFDCEFPEPARALALRGARVIVGVVASGEAGGFTSRVLVPSRAAENGVCFGWCNLPSTPLPLWTKHPAPADALFGAGCSGGSAVFGPDGRPLCALPAYASAPHRREGGATEEAWGEPGCVDTAAGVGATLALQLLRGIVHSPSSGLQDGNESAASMAYCSDGSAVLVGGRATGPVTLPVSALLPPGSPGLGVSDEAVFVVAFSPDLPRYSDSARRNPYLTARRPSIYGAALFGRVAGPHKTN